MMVKDDGESLKEVCSFFGEAERQIRKVVAGFNKHVFCVLP